MNIVLGYLTSYIYVIGLLVALSVFKKTCKAQDNDIFRKLVHIFIAFTWFILSRYLYGTWHFVIMPFSFVVITALSTKYSLIKIVQRSKYAGKDRGIIHYAISMTLICLVAHCDPRYLIPCGMGVFALSFGDGAAAVFGQAFQKTNIHITKTKTLAGSISCFVFVISGILILRAIAPFSISLAHLLTIGATASLSEIAGGRLDNYSVPFSVMIAAALMRIGEV